MCGENARGFVFLGSFSKAALNMKKLSGERRVLTLRNDVSLSPLGGRRSESDTNLDGIYLRAPHKQGLAEGAANSFFIAP